MTPEAAADTLATANAVTQLDPPMTSDVSLVIGGMTCGACAARIEYRLNKLEGVKAAVNYATERARATVAPEVSARALVEVVESIGYTAHIVTELEPAADEGSEIDRRTKMLGRRLVVAALLFMPLCDFSLVFWFIPVARFAGWQWLLVGLGAPVVTFAAWPFYSAALRGARHGTYTMDALVSLGIAAATSWSMYSMFFRSFGRTEHSIAFLFSRQAGGASYLDVAAGVTTFLLAGRYFEASTKRRTGDALRSLAAIGAKDVGVLDDDGTESRRAVSELVVGDRFVVRPGEAVATDGEVLSGCSAIDRSAMTGESLPADVGPGDPVLGGTVVAEGRLVVRTTRVGRDTQLAQMIRLVEDAQNEKADVQRLADRVSGVFVPAVIAAALLTLMGWLVTGGGTEQAVNASLSVLIIACPCALGLATPTALLVASGEGARRGIFFKGYQGLEASRRIDTVVLDKTGTVTSGQMTLTDVETVPGVERAALLAWAGALEQASEHLVARGSWPVRSGSSASSRRSMHSSQRPALVFAGSSGATRSASASRSCSLIRRRTCPPGSVHGARRGRRSGGPRYSSGATTSSSERSLSPIRSGRRPRLRCASCRRSASTASCSPAITHRLHEPSVTRSACLRSSRGPFPRRRSRSSAGCRTEAARSRWWATG